MDSRRLHAVLTRFFDRFLAVFPALTSQDLSALLAGSGETLLDLLQSRYGYTRAQAKTAWNDFVLTHVDGCGDDRSRVRRPGAARRTACPQAALMFGAGSAPDAGLWRLMRMGWGRPSSRPGPGAQGGRPAAYPLHGCRHPAYLH
ncbi:MAG: hypothetical protein IT329_17205 [Caldilineaceae bacterium]|nr:hypothetical protein [Caldilineaceae bacterium]